MTHHALCIWCGAEMGPCRDNECPNTKDHHVDDAYCGLECAEDARLTDERDQTFARLQAKATACEAACRLLIAAYEKGVGDSVKWEDLDDAFAAACKALGHSPRTEED